VLTSIPTSTNRGLKNGAAGRDPALRGFCQCSHICIAALFKAPRAPADGRLLVFQPPLLSICGTVAAACLKLGGRHVIIAGLTGGIASGKSTVAAIFEEAGARLIDADRIAREVVRERTPAYRDILSHFGKAVLRDDGKIDRKRLAAIIFNNPAEQRALERIVHPQVKKAVARQLDLIRQQAPEALAIVDIPLLFESGMDQGLDAIIVVYVPEKVQLQRLMARDALSQAEALARIQAQMPIEKKKCLATLLIDNSGSIGRTRAQALEVYHTLSLQARNQPRET
jgi:dephospho-CoA kinase